MKITIIHGQSHKGSTYHIARMLAEKVGGEITEFFLPHDFSENCLGCTSCFMKGEENCPHYEKLLPINKAMFEADLLIFASPVYVYHATGAMKSFLDHYGYMWMVHRPRREMFTKQAVCISTAAGGGTKSTNKDMSDSLFFWGVPKIYNIGVNVQATDWKSVSEKIKKSTEHKTDVIAKKIKSRNGKITPGIKTGAFFFMMSLMQKNGWNEADKIYWHEMGWTDGNKPWKKN